MKTLLITAIGSFSAKNAIEAARELGFRVIGCDINPREWLSQAGMADVFYRAVLATDGDAYISFINEVCVKEHVDLILPLTDPEVDVLSARRNELSAQLALSHDDVITTCRNKMIFNTHMRGLMEAIPTAWLADMETPESFPVVVKPVDGRSSIGLRKFETLEEYAAFRRRCLASSGAEDMEEADADGCDAAKGSGDMTNDKECSTTEQMGCGTAQGGCVTGAHSESATHPAPQNKKESSCAQRRSCGLIVQPYIPGHVVSVDIFRDPRNGYIFTLPREELIRTVNGAGTSVRIFRDEFIEDDCKLFAELFGIKGTMMLEFIMNEDGVYTVMECNPRFSGGIAFSRAAGWDFAKAHLAVYADMQYDMPPEIGEMYIVKEYSEIVTK